MRKVSKREMEFIYEFISKHYIDYTDVKMELADHIACGVEAQWQKDNSIDLNEAVENEFRKFGVFGFSKIVDEKTEQLSHLYTKIFFREFAKFAIKPLVLAVFIAVVYLVLRYIPLHNREIGEKAFNYIYATAVAGLFWGIWNLAKIKRKTNQFLYEEICEKTRILISNLFCVIIPFVAKFTIQNTMWVAVALVLYVAFFYFSFIYFPNNAEKFTQKSRACEI